MRADASPEIQPPREQQRSVPHPIPQHPFPKAPYYSPYPPPPPYGYFTAQSQTEKPPMRISTIFLILALLFLIFSLSSFIILSLIFALGIGLLISVALAICAIPLRVNESKREIKNKYSRAGKYAILTLSIFIIVFDLGTFYLVFFYTPQWSTRYGPIISGSWQVTETGDDQNFTFQFCAPSMDIEIKDVSIILESNDIRMVDLELSDITPLTYDDNCTIYMASPESVINGNITLYDNNANDKLDSHDRLTIDPDPGQDWTGWRLIIQVKRRPAMNKEIRSS